MGYLRYRMRGLLWIGVLVLVVLWAFSRTGSAQQGTQADPSAPTIPTHEPGSLQPSRPPVSSPVDTASLSAVLIGDDELAGATGMTMREDPDVYSLVDPTVDGFCDQTVRVDLIDGVARGSRPARVFDPRAGGSGVRVFASAEDATVHLRDVRGLAACHPQPLDRTAMLAVDEGFRIHVPGDGQPSMGLGLYEGQPSIDVVYLRSGRYVGYVVLAAGTADQAVQAERLGAELARRISQLPQE